MTNDPDRQTAAALDVGERRSVASSRNVLSLHRLRLGRRFRRFRRCRMSPTVTGGGIGGDGVVGGRRPGRTRQASRSGFGVKAQTTHQPPAKAFTIRHLQRVHAVEAGDLRPVPPRFWRTLMRALSHMSPSSNHRRRGPEDVAAVAAEDDAPLPRRLKMPLRTRWRRSPLAAIRARRQQ